MPCRPDRGGILLDPGEAGTLVLSRKELRRITRFLASPALPPVIEALIREYAAEKTGKEWDDPAVLGRIRTAIRSQKESYWEQEPGRRKISYRSAYSVLGYLAYHLPVYLVQTEHLLLRLAVDGLLRRQMHVLDAGSGPGVASLGLIDFCSRLEGCQVTIHAVERSEEQIEAYRFLVNRYAALVPGIRVTRPVRADLAGLDPGDLKKPFDLIVLQNVLNELGGMDTRQRAEVAGGLAARLRDDGTLLIVEPAEEQSSVALRRTVRCLVESGLVVHSPCVSLHGTRCRNDRCWSFCREVPVQPPAFQAALAGEKEAFRFVNTDIKYSYAVLRRPGAGRAELPALPPGFTPLGELGRSVGKDAGVAAAVVSGDLGNRTDHVFLLCDGSGTKPVYAVLPRYHVTERNRPLLSARYGEIVRFTGVLVRHNPKHDAFNLLVTKRSGVSREGSGDLS